MLVNVGDLFRQYRIIERVGEGGMGIVYRAQDTMLCRNVALKFMTHSPRLDSARGDRLRREARALAALNHPNILTIHEIGDADGTPFLVLEWVGGGALSDLSFQRPLSTREFARVVLPIAEALGAAHDQGIVHRDVKPANVLVSDEGRVKLADFGLARSREFDPDVTRTAGVVGTVAYMSPEQANGAEVGPTSDVFSFGVLAYELLTGQRPFEGRGPGAVIAAIVNGRYTPIVAVRRDVPGQLAAVVERCLEKDPADRFQSGRDVAHALHHALSDSDRPAPVKTVEKADAESPARTSAPAAREQEIKFCTTSDGACRRVFRRGCWPVHCSRAGPFHAPRDGMGVARPEALLGAPCRTTYRRSL